MVIICILYFSHLYAHLFILSDKVTFTKYTEHNVLYNVPCIKLCRPIAALLLIKPCKYLRNYLSYFTTEKRTKLILNQDYLLEQELSVLT